jgi:hypothetical protein
LTARGAAPYVACALSRVARSDRLAGPVNGSRPGFLTATADRAGTGDKPGDLGREPVNR